MVISRIVYAVGHQLQTINDATIIILQRGLHSNRASVCRLKRPPNQYMRLFPVRIVYKDGSTILVRHQIPRELIKLPLRLEDCQTEHEQIEWHSRRKQKEVIKIKKDDTDVQFDRSQYLNMVIKRQSGEQR